MTQYADRVTAARLAAATRFKHGVHGAVLRSAAVRERRALSRLSAVLCAASFFALVMSGVSSPALALHQDAAGESAPSIDDAAPAPARDSIDEIVCTSQALLLALQNGAEWPYEGVYRVRREIPFGYRIGGTAIAADALLRLEASGVDEPVPDATKATEASEASEPANTTGTDSAVPRRRAIDRATAFIISGAAHPDMAHTVTGTYDVRGWG